jgi:hypothetical protein
MTACRSGLLVALLLCSLATPCLAGDFLEQAAKIAFDENNFVVFEDVGRKTDAGGFSAGTAVRLHVMRDGATSVIVLTQEDDTGSQVKEIRYDDKDHLTITSRLGHRADGRTQVNLATGKVEKHAMINPATGEPFDNEVREAKPVVPPAPSPVPQPTPTPIENLGVEPVGFFGGQMGGVAASQGYACIAQGRQLRVLDVSTSTSRVVGRVTLPELPTCLSVSGTLAWVGMYGGVQVVDLSRPAAPALRGLCPLPELPGHVAARAGSVAAFDTMACVVGNFGLAVIDASDPDAPRLYPLKGEAWPIQKIALAGSAALAIDGFYGLRAIDLSNPKEPALRATCELPSHAVQDIAVSGSRAFVVLNDRGLQEIDLSDPLAPKLGKLFDPAGASAAFSAARPFCERPSPHFGIDTLSASGPLLFTACTSYPPNGSRTDLRILDVSDPSTMTVHALPSFGGGACALAASGPLLCAASDEGGLRVFDVANPRAPVVRSISPKTIGLPGKLIISGDRGYLVDCGRALKVLDLTNPVEPVMRGEWRGPDLRSMTASRSMIYLVVHPDGLCVIDASNADAPVLRGTCKWDNMRADAVLAVSGSLVHEVDYDGGYRIIDVSDPGAPRVRGRLPQQKAGRAIASAGMWIYLPGDGQLTCVDASDPDYPKVTGAVKHIGVIERMQAVGTRLYVSAATALEIYDITRPEAPLSLGICHSPDSNGLCALAVAGNLAYMASNYKGGLRVVDVSAPGQPRLVGAYGNLWCSEGTGIGIGGQYVYMTLGGGGLAILKYIGK